MQEEFSTCTRNGFQTEMTLTTQCLFAFISAFEKMGLFIPALNEGTCVWKWSGEIIGNDPSIAHVPLPMLWVQISLQCCKVLQEQNLHAYAVFIRVHQARLNVNIRGGILGDYLLGPVIIPDRLNWAAYLEFLQSTLPLLMEEIPLAIRREMWFQHDSAPAQFRLQVRAHLNRVDREKWKGKGGPVA